MLSGNVRCHRVMKVIDDVTEPVISDFHILVTFILAPNHEFWAYV